MNYPMTNKEEVDGFIREIMEACENALIHREYIDCGCERTNYHIRIGSPENPGGFWIRDSRIFQNQS